MIESNMHKKKRRKRKIKEDRNQSYSTSKSKSRKEIRKNREHSSSKKGRNKKRSRTEGFKHRKVLGAVGDFLFYVVVLLIVGGSAFIYFGDKDANIMGYKIMTVLTDSMEQTKGSGYDNGFSKGSMIVIKNQDPYTFKEGDIITFNPVRDNQEVFLTHRIVGIDEKKKEEREAFITTKGDANTGTDVPIGASQVTGKVVRNVPNAGFVLSFLKKNVIVVAILISTSFGIIVTLKYARTIE